MSDRSVVAALARLVEQGVLTEEQREAVIVAVARERATKETGGRWIAEIAAYAGAGLLLGGFVLLLSSSWSDLDLTAQVSTLALVTVVLVVGGYALAGGLSALFVRGGAAQSVAARLGAALFALAAVCVSALFARLLGDMDSPTSWVWAVLAGLVVAVIGYAALPSLVGLLTCAVFAPVVVAGFLLDIVKVDDLAIDLGVVAVGGIWFAVSRFGFAEPTWAGYSVAIVTGLAGALIAGEEATPWAYGLAFLVAVACFALYATQRTSVLVLGGAVALAIAVSIAVWDWTGGGTATFLIVLLAGALVLGFGITRLVGHRDGTPAAQVGDRKGTPGSEVGDRDGTPVSEVGDLVDPLRVEPKDLL